VQNAVLSSHNTSPAGAEVRGIWRAGFPGTSHKTTSARFSRRELEQEPDTILHEWQWSHLLSGMPPTSGRENVSSSYNEAGCCHGVDPPRERQHSMPSYDAAGCCHPRSSWPGRRLSAFRTTGPFVVADQAQAQNEDISGFVEPGRFAHRRMALHTVWCGDEHTDRRNWT